MLVDLVGVGHAACWLRCGGQPPAGGQLQRLDDQAPAQRGQLVVQGASGGGWADGQSLHQQHVAGVQAGVHLHDGHAGFGIARFDGAVDGRGTAPARQHGGVDVETSEPGQRQHPLRQDQTVGGDHHHIGLCGLQRLLGSSRVVRVFAIQAQAARLGHGDAVLQRELLDGRGLQLHAAAGGAVRLRQHQRHAKTRGEQALQRHAGEIRRAGEDDVHGQSGEVRRRRQGASPRPPWAEYACRGKTLRFATARWRSGLSGCRSRRRAVARRRRSSRAPCLVGRCR